MIVKKSRYFRGYKFSRIYIINKETACDHCNLFHPSYSFCESCTAAPHLRHACDMLYSKFNDNFYSFIPTKHVIKEI